MLRLAFFVGWMGAIGAVIAGPVRMTGEDIKRAMMPGALLEIDTPLHIAIPVKVSTHGIVSAEAGALGLTLGATKDRGRWWTEGDKLCMKWFRWFDAKPRCMTLQRDGNKIYWQEGSGETGTATLSEANEIVANSYSKPAITPSPNPQPEKPASTGPATADAPAPVSKLGGGTPSEFAQHAKLATAPPPPARSDQPKARLRVARQPKVPALATRQSQQSAAPAQLFRVVGVQAGDELNVRSGPSEYHSAVGRIPFDERKIEIVGECFDVWCPIRHAGVVGWVNSFYLEDDGAPRGRTRPAGPGGDPPLPHVLR